MNSWEKLWQIISRTETLFRGEEFFNEEFEASPPIQLLEREISQEKEEENKARTENSFLVEEKQETVNEEKETTHANVYGHSENEEWQEIFSNIISCQKCSLRKEEEKPLVGLGNISVDILIITGAIDREGASLEKPLGEEEFDYLRKWLDAIGLRDKYYLTNMVKCRPPGNRPPFANEVKSCLTHLVAQARFHRPKAILTLGGEVARGISGVKKDLSILRQTQIIWQDIPVIATYHPKDVLLNPEQLRVLVWQDLKDLQRLIQLS